MRPRGQECGYLRDSRALGARNAVIYVILAPSGARNAFIYVILAPSGGACWIRPGLPGTVFCGTSCTSILFGKNRDFRYKKVENRRFVREVSRGRECYCARLLVKHCIVEFRKLILSLFAWVARLGYRKIAKDFKSLVFFRRNCVSKMTCFHVRKWCFK